ncbi:MAG: acyl-CoA dehydrogenase family protein, partial [Alphaproteobacteria bacterium]|nr:acyl-CoA dehydrogenase family protein [Alphaproteobacteria bacterium]
MTDLDAFRAETRAWLEANCPAECRGPVESDEDRVWGGRNAGFPTPAHKVWLDRMGAKGWTAPEWPAEYGGGGLSREQAKVLGSEMRRIDAQAPLASFGVWMLGPALLAFGTEEQKQRFLPEIVRGEIRWCQGYSEPGAGSDLAAIQTRAEDKGDHWIVNGQKVWTSYADKADWIFCLVRTDPDAPKHLGISFVLFDMATKGVSTRPITLISGKSPFCETFFDDVRVEKANLIGTLNRGWDVAKHLLAHERTMIGAMGEVGGGRPLGQVATGSIGMDDEGRLDEPMLRARIAELEIDAAAFRLAMERAGDQVKAGQAHPAIASMLKYYG